MFLLVYSASRVSKTFTPYFLIYFVGAHMCEKHGTKSNKIPRDLHFLEIEIIAFNGENPGHYLCVVAVSVLRKCVILRHLSLEEVLICHQVLILRATHRRLIPTIIILVFGPKS